MEKESFEDDEVAELLNNSYIAIKVDREERPDVDSVYMSVCHAMTGSGGWPLTIIMDTEKRPFFAGTYFPKNSMGRHMGFMELLNRILDLWNNERENIKITQEKIVEVIKQEGGRSNKNISPKNIDKALQEFKRIFDPKYGGFGSAPKFPSPHNLMFLIRAYYVYNDKDALEIVTKTLDGMAFGGIYDHIGFGFCRYSTDEKWLVPHFEKMLYDNALLAITYAEAYKICGKDMYKTVAKQVLTYILRDMTDKNGGFYSAEDADSEGEEGKFYIWDKKEALNILKEQDGERYCKLYNITDKGNFEGKNIPNLLGEPVERTNEFGSDSSSELCRKKLFDAREERVHPLKDTKILASWNGMMIAAFAICGRFFSNDEYVQAAQSAADFVLKELYDGKVLYARYRDGHVLKKSFADDYAYMIWGLLELYEATFNADYLIKALELNDYFISHFYDHDSGGIFLYPDKSEKLITRPKEIYDGAVPSSNAVAVYNLIRLGRLTGDSEHEQRAYDILNYFTEDIERHPSAFSFSLISLMYLTAKSQEIVITAYDTDLAAEAIANIKSRFMPFLSAVLVTNDRRIKEIAPFTADYPVTGDKWTVFVCEDKSCSKGVSDMESLNTAISAVTCSY